MASLFKKASGRVSDPDPFKGNSGGGGGVLIRKRFYAHFRGVVCSFKILKVKDVLTLARQI